MTQQEFSNLPTKRDLFAAFAMLGHFIWNQNVKNYDVIMEDLAKFSYKMADAMIEADSKPEGK